MLYRANVAVYSEIHTNINTLCGQNVKFQDVKPCVTQSNHYALNGEHHKQFAVNYQ